MVATKFKLLFKQTNAIAITKLLSTKIMLCAILKLLFEKKITLYAILKFLFLKTFYA